MLENSAKAWNGIDRRHFMGGSDARIIMGADEGALIRLWREKRGETEPDDLSGNLIVQLGVVTEPLNRHWFERQRSKRSSLDAVTPRTGGGRAHKSGTVAGCYG